MGEVVSQNCHFFLFQAQGEVVLHRLYRKNIPNEHHFSSKLRKTIKTSPCFKFVGLSLEIDVQPQENKQNMHPLLLILKFTLKEDKSKQYISQCALFQNL